MSSPEQQQIDEALRLHREKNWPAAAAAYQALLKLPGRANDPSLLSNLGDVLRNLGSFDAAADALQRAINAAPDFAAGHGNLGIVLLDQQRFDQAIVHLTRATQLGPASLPLLMALAKSLQQVGRLEEAVTAFRAAIKLRPNWPTACYQLGVALNDLGRFDEAIEAFGAAADQDESNSDAWIRLGDMLRRRGALTQSEAVLRKAVARFPDNADAHTVLAHTLRDRLEADEALLWVRRAVELKPESPPALNMLASLLIDIGEVVESFDRIAEAHALNPGDARLHSNVLYQMHLLERFTPQQMFDAHRAWAQQHERPIMPSADRREIFSARSRDPDRPLRIGYVSPDFSGHPVGRFILPVIRNHDRRAFHVTCYADMLAPDDTTRRLEAAADIWRLTSRFSHEQLADLVRADEIDLLIDLTGHTARHRLLTFARRAAPVQVTYLGYPNTTGMSQMDWRISDAMADPPGATDQWHTERLMRLPRAIWCFDPPTQSPALAASRTNERTVTFGSFNTLAKTSETALNLWAKVLHAVPSSNMIIKTRGLMSADACRRLHEKFHARGVDPARIELRRPVRLIEEHLAAYADVDIALDTFPYVGTTTTCEAMWMGVPVVTLAGETHVSRVGASLLRTAGLEDLIAASLEDFIRIATELAQDAARRAELRQSLRPRLSASPLMDAAGFTRDLESAYRAMWRDYCESRDL